MKLSKIAILAIKGQKDSVKKIASLTNYSTKTVYRWVAENDDNLTKAAVINYLKDLTGLAQEEILEAEDPALVGTTDQK
jgi:transposase